MTKNNNKVDIHGLRSLYLASPEARVILAHFSKFVNNMGETKVHQLLGRLSSEENQPSRGAVINFFRELERLGCGRLVLGRRTGKTRFVWEANLTDVSRAAQGQKVDIGDAPSTDEVEETTTRVALGNTELVEHPFHLRKNLDIRMGLPEDLTASEAARLAAFIKTLPLEEENQGTLIA